MIYCDTSLLISVLTKETHSEAARLWLASRPPGTLSTSVWTSTEVASALSLKVRTRELDEDWRERAHLSWATIRRQGFEMEDVESADFVAAVRFLDRHELALRAGDALHLAIASNRGMSIATLDRKMAAAGAMFGMTVEQVLWN